MNIHQPMLRYAPIQQLQANGNMIHLLKVTGEGVVYASPDRAQITLGVTTENRTVLEAQRENNLLIQAIIHSLISIGVPQEMIQTISFQIDPQYDYIDGQQIFRNYRVQHLLQITLDQIDLVGTVIDLAVESGANIISSVEFTLQDTSRVYNQALTFAINEAKEKARTITNSISALLIETPVNIREIPPDRFPITQRPVLYATEATQFQTGIISVKALIELEFSYTSY